MAIFLTQYRNMQGRQWCGPDIRARTWRGARIRCWLWRIFTLRPSLRILGALVERILAREINGVYLPTDERTLYAPPKEER